MKKKWIWISVAIVLVVVGWIGFPKVTEEITYIRAMKAYVYGFPLVIMDATKDVLTATNHTGEYRAPINQFGRIRTYVNPDRKDVVRISVNSLWSHAFVDLDKEPVVYSQPDTRGRFIVMQVLNMWTDDIASVGSRTTGTEAGNFLIAGPNWKGTAPADMKQIVRCSTRYAWVLVQISCASTAEYAEIHALQDGLHITPLSAWGKAYTPPPDVPVNPNADTTATPLDQLRLMDGVTFFQRLATAMKDNPPYPADAEILSTLERIGVVPGKDFDPASVSPEVSKAMNRAAQQVFSILGTAQYEMKSVNGWLLPVNLGRYGTDYNTRAFVAYMGLGALTSDDAVYPTAFVDAEGKVLNGANKYVIQFQKDGLFPSHSGVWSISPYRENFYVHNPIERYGILSSMPLKFNNDGTLDIYVQAMSPGAEKETNWLPVPKTGPFNLTIRVYQPKKEIMDGRTENNVLVEAGTYKIPPVKRVE